MAESTVARDERRFYVYVVFRPNGEPCYIGKGTGPRWRLHPKHRNNPHLKRIANLAPDRRLPTVVIRSELTEDEGV